MFNIISKKLDDAGIIDAVKRVRQGESAFDRKKAYLDLRETFQPLMFKLFSKIKGQIRSSDDVETVKAYIESEFYKILIESRFDLDNVIQIKATILKVLNGRINQDTIKHELGYTPLIHDYRRIEADLGRALSTFHKQYHREPDLLNSETDIELMAKLLNKTVETVNEMVSVLGPNKIRSIYDTSGGTDDENVKTLIDVLRSDEPIPDKVYDDKMLLQALMSVVQRSLTPDERKVFSLYYNLDDPGAEEKQIDDIAAKLGVPYRRIRYLLDNSKAKVIRDPKLREMYANAQRKEFIKMAMKIYDIISIANEKYYVNIQKVATLNSDEQIVQQIIHIAQLS